MSFRRMISILLARKKIALALFLASIAVVMGISFILPEQYTANAAVVVDTRPDPINALMSPMATNLAFVATQVDVIKSDRVLYQVMRSQGLLENQALKQQWLDEEDGKGSMQVWLAELFKKRIDVTPSRESNVINVSYTAQDPRFAAGMANAIVGAYMQTALELRTDPARQYSSFFEVRAKDAREALEKAQSRLSAFQRESGLLATDERMDVENARLAELSSQAVQLQALSSEAASRKAQSQGAQADRLQEVLNNPVIAGLKADLARQDARLKELTAKFGESHPQVIETRASNAELREKVDQETKRVSSSLSVTNAIQMQRDATGRAALEAQRERLLKLRSTRDEGQVLQREVENAQRTYDGVMARLTQSSIESQATLSNIGVLSQAVPPNDPSSPKLLLNAILSVLLGLLLAFGGVLALESLDARVRGAEDAVEMLGVPLMGIILAPGGKQAATVQPLMLSGAKAGR
jgi:succinoglycan biosynthesis transport protein ExoP